MRGLVEFLLKGIVTNPDGVLVKEAKEGNSTNISIVVAPEDMGLVIGKSGRTIKSIRTLAKAKAVKDGLWANVELTDPYSSP